MEEEKENDRRNNLPRRTGRIACQDMSRFGYPHLLRANHHRDGQKEAGCAQEG